MSHRTDNEKMAHCHAEYRSRCDSILANIEEVDEKAISDLARDMLQNGFAFGPRGFSGSSKYEKISRLREVLDDYEFLTTGRETLKTSRRTFWIALLTLIATLVGILITVASVRRK